MFYIRTSSFIISLHFYILIHSLEDLSFLDDKLTEEERNERCCAQHLDCCVNKPSGAEPTNFEVRALLVNCPKPDLCAEDKRAVCSVQGRRKKQSGEEECDEVKPRGPFSLTKCNKKLKLTVKIRNGGITNCKNQYIIIDHVFDPLSQKKQKLVNPYVLKIKQHPIMQAYPLICGNLVNYEAKEKVMNKQDEGYTGCNTDPQSNPTCGPVKYNDEVIPYSTGFCCSCDNETHAEITTDETAGFTSNLDNADLMGDVQSEFSGPRLYRKVGTYSVPELNKNNDGRYEFGGKIKEDGAVNQPNIMVDNVDSAKPFQSVNDQRLMPLVANPRRTQKRGGQDCSDTYTPPNANPESYHDSTHCLEFSDVWYTIYHLAEPKLFHCLQIQIYNKIQDQEGNFRWRDLTRNSPITVGTHNLYYINDHGSIAVNYMSKDVSSHMFSLNYKIQKLLVPDVTKNIDVSQYPALQGGPKEYLVVNENQVQPNGKMCDVAGVGYEAFAKQPNRCDVPKGTCLKNQPKDMWEHDRDAEASGKKGSYFLKYFGLLPDNPIVVNGTAKNKTLVLYYTQCHTSVVDLEVKADNNVVLRPNALAVLTEVYVDSSHPQKTSIVAKVFNSGFVASVFLVKLTDCPMSMPASFSNIASKPALIPPQHQHVFNLEIHCALPMSKFYCAIEVLNMKNELIAVRKIRLVKQDRCICVWHCLCACLLADGGLKCYPLSLEHYHAAGFQGGMPCPLQVVNYTFLDDMISLMLYILLYVCLTLLIMGLVKAIVGCFMVPIGLWGLDMILGLPKKINKYYESSIRSRKVVYDRQGWPVHPDTKQRVRNISLPTEFCINVVFFFVYPFAVLWCVIKKLCISPYPKAELPHDLDVCECKQGKYVKKKSTSKSLDKKKSSSSKAGSSGSSKKSSSHKRNDRDSDNDDNLKKKKSRPHADDDSRKGKQSQPAGTASPQKTASHSDRPNKSKEKKGLERDSIEEAVRKATE